MLNPNYEAQARGDIERVIARSEQETDAAGKFAIQAGAFQELYRSMALVAERERRRYIDLANHPLKLAASICRSGITPGELSSALYVLGGSILPSDIIDWEETQNAIERAAEAASHEQARLDRRDADLDREAAARSDEAYGRKIDAGLIGRSDLLPNGAL